MSWKHTYVCLCIYDDTVHVLSMIEFTKILIMSVFTHVFQTGWAFNSNNNNNQLKHQIEYLERLVLIIYICTLKLHKSKRAYAYHYGFKFIAAVNTPKCSSQKRLKLLLLMRFLICISSISWLNTFHKLMTELLIIHTVFIQWWLTLSNVFYFYEHRVWHPKIGSIFFRTKSWWCIS